MQPQQRQQKIAQGLKTVTIICAALAMSVVVYLGVLLLIKSQGIMGPMALPPALAYVLLAAGVGMVGMGRALPPRLLPAPPPLAQDGDPEPHLKAFLVRAIISFALYEGGAIMGLVASLTTMNPLWSGILTVVALGAMASGWPSAAAFARFSGGSGMGVSGGRGGTGGGSPVQRG